MFRKRQSAELEQDIAGEQQRAAKRVTTDSEYPVAAWGPSSHLAVASSSNNNNSFNYTTSNNYPYRNRNGIYKHKNSGNLVGRPPSTFNQRAEHMGLSAGDLLGGGGEGQADDTSPGPEDLDFLTEGTGGLPGDDAGVPFNNITPGQGSSSVPDDFNFGSMGSGAGALPNGGRQGQELNGYQRPNPRPHHQHPLHYHHQQQQQPPQFQQQEHPHYHGDAMSSPVFEPSPPSPLQEMPSDYPHMHRHQWTGGYREGIISVTQQGAHEMFMLGFGCGQAYGSRSGRVLGQVESHLAGNPTDMNGDIWQRAQNELCPEGIARDLHLECSESIKQASHQRATSDSALKREDMAHGGAAPTWPPAAAPMPSFLSMPTSMPLAATQGTASVAPISIPYVGMSGPSMPGPSHLRNRAVSNISGQPRSAPPPQNKPPQDAGFNATSEPRPGLPLPPSSWVAPGATQDDVNDAEPTPPSSSVSNIALGSNFNIASRSRPARPQPTNNIAPSDAHRPSNQPRPAHPPQPSNIPPDAGYDYSNQPRPVPPPPPPDYAIPGAASDYSNQSRPVPPPPTNYTDYTTLSRPAQPPPPSNIPSGAGHDYTDQSMPARRRGPPPPTTWPYGKALNARNTERRPLQTDLPTLDPDQPMTRWGPPCYGRPNNLLYDHPAASVDEALRRWEDWVNGILDAKADGAVRRQAAERQGSAWHGGGRGW